ncbi:MAG: RdgB/HAM1 family non-canonical purine NTP pyrophosphatase [Candidatus Methylomirabilis oxygeniifera]|uniref:dITP/XTP pyrophosphatase n=1 Tax=Methylomirabilis oxygeniifera TaxID=671143 RepID=D5MGK9_METO1|nr:MAG: RdgB/HAM1 family non-canonical purine NTP pyrophosphatase [Candidatus Methylomirabilis oxyfera]CBE68890.1 putative HAM1 protein [Candidatus Methylomirabilis oxyfera]
MQVIVATANAGKFREVVTILSDLRISFLPLASLRGYNPPDEAGVTYAENAAAKAKAVAAFSGCWVLADDSGLEVDALEGQPGVCSSRYLGPTATDLERNQRILELLEGIPCSRRGARFQCVVAVAGPGGELALSYGSCDGMIAEAPSGNGGFGYDPIFIVPDLGASMASLQPDVKNRISHRARALLDIKPLLQRLASATT